MAVILPPTPIGVPPGHSFWNDWYEKLRTIVNEGALNISWSNINFAGSSLADIASRNHNTLQSIQGGQTGERYHLTAAQHAALGSGGGGVSSVGFSAPVGFTVSGSPITSSGTIVMAFTGGYSLPLTSSQTNWDTAFGWGNHASAGYLLPASIGVTVQGYNANTVIDAAYVHTDNNFTTSQVSKLAGIQSGATNNSPDSFLLSRNNHTGFQSQATITSLVTDLANKQPLDVDLTAIAALTGTNTIYYRSATGVWSPVTIGANITFTGGVLEATGGGGGGGGASPIISWLI